ncbi:DUF3037 domain-containing protein [Rathayibacter toxicus]|uniref:DUF3037 domain-containing protein n=1 Tax=Rathayibacter toxicus TaxID=145458 RepID=UPI0015E2E2F2|nr:DUF3037 domain-containing protein [Rathayibacter toxicus]QOD10769.1 DUF3037 domain-containing protein [Rathayibacter toxicus]
MTYRYWIIRFVPNVARGEFTNIGLVCGRDGGDWAVRFDPRFVRNRGNLSSDLRELSGWIGWFRRAIEAHGAVGFGEQPVGSGWIENLRARQANSVQFSDPAPIVGETAQAGIDLLFPHLVERESVRHRRSVTRRTLRADIRDTLLYEGDLTEDIDLFVQPKARIGKQRGSFDLLRTDNETNALTNVWAFNVSSLDVLEREIQSWNYLVTRFRNDGAELWLGSSRTVTLPADAPIDVVYDPPTSDRDDWRTDIFGAAQEAWRLNGVAPYTTQEFHKRSLELVH